MNAINAHAPMTLEAAFRLAEQAGRTRRRMSVRWGKYVYYRCTRCEKWKRVDRFPKYGGPRSASGRSSHCRLCHRKQTRDAKAKRHCECSFPPPRTELKFRTSTLDECWGETAAVLDSVGSLDDKPTPPMFDGGNPHRLGQAGPERVAELHRGRYERLRQIDPTLTWEDWTQLTDRRPPGRQPKPGGHAEQQAARAKRRAEREAARGGWAWAGEESE